MKRMIRSLVLAGSVAVWFGCDAFVGEPPLAWYDLEVVERLAPDCLEAGYEAMVCGCTLHHMANAMKDQTYFEFALARPAGRKWPGDAGGALARWHASCETWAVALGPQATQVSAGPPD